MTVTPIRITLADALTQLGRLDEAAASYTCECSLVAAAADMVDVRDRPDLFRTPFVCQACLPVLHRQLVYESEQAAAATAAALGLVDGEVLNGLRAGRKWRLRDTDWIEASAARERVGAARSAALDAYRAACHAVVETYQTTGQLTDFPDAPE
jgi:hypothetical protein